MWVVISVGAVLALAHWSGYIDLYAMSQPVDFSIA